MTVLACYAVAVSVFFLSIAAAAELLEWRDRTQQARRDRLVHRLQNRSQG